MKTVINIFRNRFSVVSWIAFALLVLVIAALVMLNADILNMTRGHYNMFDILFI